MDQYFDLLSEWLPPCVIVGGLLTSSLAAWLMRESRPRR